MTRLALAARALGTSVPNVLMGVATLFIAYGMVASVGQVGTLI